VQDTSSQSIGHRLVQAVFVFGSAVFAAWTVDVAANLSVLQRLIDGVQAQGTGSDYFGLFIAETQVAALVVILGFVLGPLLARVMRSDDAGGFSVMLSSAILSGIVMLAQTHITWSMTPPHDPLAFTASAYLLEAAIIVAVFALLYLADKRQKDGGWGIERILITVFCPALLVGFANLVLSQMKSNIALAKVNLPAVLVILVVTALVLWVRSRLIKAVVTAAAVVAVMLLVFRSISVSAGFGITNDTAVVGGDGRKPDIVLIVLDTVRADHLDLHGYGRQTMPALTRWAQDATVFDRAVSPGGWTTPSHASMLSGKPVSLHGIHYSATQGSFKTRPLKGVRWLPQRLADKGYYCLGVSANALALPKAITGFKRTLVPRRHRWALATIAALADHQSPLLRRFNERSRWRLPYMDARGVVDTVMRATPDGNGPVFLFVNFLDAHSPFNPPESAIQDLGVEAPRAFNRYKNHREITHEWQGYGDDKDQAIADLYDAELRGIDNELERLLDWVDERFGNGTTVIVTSDHGEELGEDGRIGHEYGLGQSIIHVPLIVRNPHWQPGRRNEIVTVRNIDKFMAAVANGRDTRPEMMSNNDEHGIITERYPSAHNIKNMGQEYNRSWISVFEGQYKAVGPSVNGFELFDIESSGFDREEVVFDATSGAHLKLRIDTYWETKFDRREKDIQFEPASEEELKRLRALGYIK
jgi:arylsulfatase A-like enzyme